MQARLGVGYLNMIFVSALRDEEGRDLPKLLESSAACNQGRAIRSMVLFAAGNVMQVIDGEASQVRSEWERICSNHHYLNSIVLNEEAVDVPSLSATSLGAHRLQPAIIEKLPLNVAFFALNQDAVAQRLRSGIAKNLLKQFAADYS